MEYFDSIFIGAPSWQPWSIGFVAVVALLLVAGYWRAPIQGGWKWVAAFCKLLAIVAMALCILEPLRSETVAKKGENLFLIVSDNSSSLAVRNEGASESRAESLKALLKSDEDWQIRLAQDFDVRRYRFDSRLAAVGDFESLKMDSENSSLYGSLSMLEERFRSRPVAGILLFTDGNATDEVMKAAQLDGLPPIYPVLWNDGEADKDISVRLTAVQTTNFEAAPVTLRAEVVTHGYIGKQLAAVVTNEAGEEVERLEAKAVADGKPLEFRFQLKPEKLGIEFYKLRVATRDAISDIKTKAKEATLVNNERMVAVDRGGGPYRVLYISGRPNWEFKFLNRAAAEDDEVQLTGLIRIARKEAKFDFRGRRGETTNSLFRGFGNEDDDDAEKYNEDVFRVFGHIPEDNLLAGNKFPKGEEELFKFHAVVLDDIEAGAFTQDQLSLIKRFVYHRGGALLTLGGQEAFVKGGFSKTALNDLIPVYMDPLPPADPMSRYRLSLTQEGWLQPWIRTRSTEEEEEKRLQSMPQFHVVNRVQNFKPGATVLASIENGKGQMYPALVGNASAGRGRTAALLIGDYWRWGLRREDPTVSDLAKSWRQTLRWLVAEVPQHVDVRIEKSASRSGAETQLIRVEARDEKYEPMVNASVAVEITDPQGQTIKLTADASSTEAGVYSTEYVPRTSGPYRVNAKVTSEDESIERTREAAWVTEPAAEEFRSLEWNKAELQRLADRTDGEVVTSAKLESFVESLPTRKVPISEERISSIWDRLWVFAFAVFCLCCEWGVRRWKGLP